ncbi:collagen binding domain-containing protein, partial [Solibacillus silvestris]|uniref:collagen binding domain-containing protein n=1 Tax=Solibacillus silvestris TaxID=76853 RepID=UPI003F7DEB50
MKKLNIAILTILLVFQTILGPIGSYQTVFADDGTDTLDLSDGNAAEETASELENSLMNTITATPDSAALTFNTVVDRQDPKLREDISLQINGLEVSSSVSAPLGSEIKYRVVLNLEAGHNYGAGSTLSYELPSQFAQLTVTPQDLYMGTMIIGTVTISGQTAIVTFSENIRGESGGLPTEAWFEVSGKLQSTSGNWQDTIQVPGFEVITLNYTPASTGNTITKNGAADRSGKNSEFITWTVDVNTNLTVNTASGSTKFSDTLTGAHEFDSIVSITELNIAPNGTVTEGSPVTSLPTISGKAMEIDLPNKEYTGYRIVYKTKIGDPGNVASANFGNEAKYNGIPSGKKNVPVSFGTPLQKTVSGPNNDLTANWTIKYNHNKRTISQVNAVLTDTWTQGHVLEGNIVVYDEAGTIAVDSNLYTVTPNDDTNGFTLTFKQEVTEAYTIKYKTKPSGIYPTNGLTNKNTVTRQDMTTGGTSTVAASYPKERFVLDKTAEGVNYADKTMNWKIKANSAGYNLASGTTFVDTYNGSLLKVQGTPIVTVGGQSFTDFTFTTTTEADGKETGFELVLNKAVSEEVVVTYTTEYTIKDSGVNDRTYQNTVNLTNTGIFGTASTTDSASQSIKEEQKANGKKEGYYNYQTKTFHWDVEVNFNYNSFTNAIFKDSLPESQKVKSITVTEGALDAAGSFVPGPVKTIPNISGKDNEIVLELGAIIGPYKITYESIDADQVFPHGSGKETILNEAALYEGTSTTANASWGKTVAVEHTEKILHKEGTQDGTSPKVNWNFKFNYAQSELNNIVITDTVGKIDGDPSQLILKDSFKVWEMNFTGINSTPAKGNPVILTNENLIVDIENGVFTLNLPDGDKAYYVEYSTVFMGPSGSALENLVEVSYTSADGSQGSDQYSHANFTYSGGGSVSTMKLVILKTDASTGQPMPNVKFDLFGPYTGSTLLASKTTNADGYLDYGLKLAQSTQGQKYKVVEETVPGYQPLTYEFELDPAKVETSGKYAGYQVIQLSNIPTTLACSKFTVTLYDVDGKPYVTGNKVTFKNKSTEKTVEYTIGTNGKLVFKHSEGASGNEPVLAAGKYDVTYGGITKEIDVNYGNSPCNIEIKPSPSCPVFTVTLNEKDADGNDKPRVGVTVTLKDSSDNQVTTATPLITDANGKITIPSTTPAGKYTVYEGSQYLGEITVSYRDDCGTSLTQAPKCPTFTLTVKDADGKPVSGKTVIVKTEDDSKTIPVTNPTDSTGNVTLNNLEPGKYIVYEADGTTKIGEFTTTTDCKAEVQPNPSCPIFVLTVKDEDGNLSEGTVVILTDSTDLTKTIEATVGENGEVQLATTTPVGNYKVKIKTTGKELGNFDLSYTGDCEEVVELPRACTVFAITVKNPDGTPKQNAEVIVEDSSGNPLNLTTSTTDGDGKIQLPPNQSPGQYSVYEVNTDGSKGEKIGDVKVTYTSTCVDDVIKNACPQFTLTINNSNVQPVGANVTIVIKKADGTVVATSVTNSAGQIVYSKVDGTLQEGETYKVFNTSGSELGTINVSYIDEICGASVQVPTNSCPIFTLTVQNQYGMNRPNITVTIKDANENTIAAGTTDADGKITVPYTVEPGTYKVYEGTTLLGTITTQNCDAVFKPENPVTPTPGGGGNTPPPTNPGEPTNPGTPPTNPGEPTNPGTPPTNPGEPTNPGTPPTNPGEPTNPGTPPTNPGEPTNPGTPPTNPGEPTNPGTPPTNPGEPTNPGTPP